MSVTDRWTVRIRQRVLPMHSHNGKNHNSQHWYNKATDTDWLQNGWTID